MSSKAIWRSVFISLLSLVISYAFAYFTSEISVVSIFILSPSWRSVALFALFVCGCVVGDFFSFAQTRVFLRAVDGMRQGIVSIGLALADAVISLAIFVGFFSITRLIAYLVIMGTTPQGTIRQELSINTDALRATIASLQKDGFATPSELEWPIVLANVHSEKEASKVDEIARQYTNELVQGVSAKQFVSVDVKFKCENNIYTAVMQLDNVVSLITKEISSRRGVEISGSAYDNIRRDVEARVKAWRPNNAKCVAPTVYIKGSLTPAGLLSVAGGFNALSASFERTLYDFYTNVGFKLAPYASVDPEADIGEFYDSLIQQTRFGFLGLTYGNPNIDYALSEFAYKSDHATERLQIPFSPMLASCLTVSLLFGIYIVLIYASRVLTGLKKTALSFQANVNVDTAPFTYLGIGFTVMSVIIYTISRLSSYIWSWLFGSLV
jgi:hypothetical protein